MTPNTEKHGFKIIRTRQLDELCATLYELEHTESGARIIYLDREDENMTFSIGFATPPENDTGVFHIIEHSVLCGSRKYPLRDPFAELLKGSLNTFLNAITYEDRTVYPVSSRCEKDFLNLVDVYMDAVLHPCMLENPCIFRQEGWHYEYSESDNSLSISGVVYNEMKGAYSSADELGAITLTRSLFPNSPYRYDSGGEPSHIPELSYGQLKSAHEKHYHPSGARIILDGRIDLDKLLPLLDRHLSGYGRRESVEMPKRGPAVAAPARTVKYEISESEDEKGRARVLYGFVYSDFSDSEAHLTAAMLCDLLCGSNASPLKKALLDKGLCKDAAMYCNRSVQQTLVLEIRDADEDRIDEIDETVESVIRDLAENGIGKDKLTATLNSIEFRLRERDYGSLPTGIAFAMSIYGVWMYGGLPEDALLVNDTLRSVREKTETEHFEKALLRATVDNPHRAKVIMLPDRTLGGRTAKEEADRLRRILCAMSDEELERVKEEQNALRLWQETEEDEAAAASLPTLSLSDIPKKQRSYTTETYELSSVPVHRCRIKTNGIFYISLYLDASDLKEKELTRLAMLSSALMNFPTEKYDALSLQNIAKSELGSLYASFAVAKKEGEVTPYLKIGASALTSKAGMLAEILGQLFTTKITDEKETSDLLSQARSHIEDSIIASGESVALSRIEAANDGAGAAAEYLSGYEAYLELCNILKAPDGAAALTGELSELLKRLTDKKRLTVSVTGEISDEDIERIIALLPEKNGVAERRVTPPCSGKSEFFLIPSKVAYAAAGGRSERVRENLSLMRVVRSILSYEYLWSTVRMKNGAYGTGFVPRRDGSLAFYSYRDPSPSASLEFFRDSSAYLRRLAEENADITKFIIGAIGEYDTLITPRIAAAVSARDYLSGYKDEDEAAVRDGMLTLSCRDLTLAADIIDEVMASECVAMVGSREHLDSLPNPPEKVLVI